MECNPYLDSKITTIAYMSYKDEIEELKVALAASPDNKHLTKMLIKKMEQHKEYDLELEPILQNAIKQNSDDIVLKESLIRLYYRQGKHSTCIVIAEEYDIDLLTSDVRAMVAKCYLKEDNIMMAQNIYQDIVEDEPDYEDETLDEAFRMKDIRTDVDGLDQAIFSAPMISFADVGGMDNVKREIEMKIIKPLENAELFASYGKKIGGGILLYGPPGCGKTYIAKATAGQINANFINISLDDILDMWIGNSEKNLSRYFDLARSQKPCVLFFDEVDALGAKRSDLRQSAGKNVINQFLAELDGMNSDNDGLLIIGATNVPWHLDSAFRRPGRFDRIIFVPPPDESSKEEILKINLKGKPFDNIDYKKIARKTPEYSGADLNALVDIAVEEILEDAMKTGIPRPITTKDLLLATKKHKASTVDWFTTAKNYAMFANKSGLYDDILKYLKL